MGSSSDSFEHELIFVLTCSLSIREKSCSIPTHMVMGSKHSEESKQKIREAAGGGGQRELPVEPPTKRYSPEWREKQRRLKIGNTYRLGKLATPHGHKFERHIDAYIRKCNDRGLVWEITRERATELMLEVCRYCGTPPIPSEATGGIDRLDNSLGYVEGNVAAACFRCNISKHTMNEAEFEQWIATVHAHLQARRN